MSVWWSHGIGVNLGVFGEQNIKLHILGEEKEVSLPVTFVFPNSKEGSVNCPVMQSENLGGHVWYWCAFTSCYPSIISMAKRSAFKWQLQTNTELWFPSDNNECATEINLCGAKGICQNTPGSFVCECQRGFSLDQTGQSCEGGYYTVHLTWPSLASLIFFQPYCQPTEGAME